MKKILALSLALIMLVSLMSALSVSAENLDLTTATLNTFDKDKANYYVASTADTTPVKFAVTGNAVTLNGSMESKNTNYTSLNYRDVFTSETNVDEHVTQTIKIDVMPIFEVATYRDKHHASGYFNVLTRNYKGDATATPLQPNKTAAECYDSIMYSIYCVDAEGNLAMQLYYMGYNDSGVTNFTVIPVPSFAEKLGEAFTLTTVWHADNKVTFICDGEELGTFDNATFASKVLADRRDYLSIGYNGCGAVNNGSNPVNLTVSDVKISHGHDEGTDAPSESTPAESTPAESTPAESTPAESTPAESTPAESTPAESTPAESTPATSAPAATTAPATTTPSNPGTGSPSNAMYVALLTVSMLAMAALMIPEIRNKLIRK